MESGAAGAVIPYCEPEPQVEEAATPPEILIQDPQNNNIMQLQLVQVHEDIQPRYVAVRIEDPTRVGVRGERALPEELGLNPGLRFWFRRYLNGVEGHEPFPEGVGNNWMKLDRMRQRTGDTIVFVLDDSGEEVGVWAHRQVLVKSSQYFNKYFQRKPDYNIVGLAPISVAIFKLFLELFYWGEVVVRLDQIPSFWEAEFVLRIREVGDLTWEYDAETLPPEENEPDPDLVLPASAEPDPNIVYAVEENGHVLGPVGVIADPTLAELGQDENENVFLAAVDQQAQGEEEMIVVNADELLRLNYLDEGEDEQDAERQHQDQQDPDYIPQPVDYVTDQVVMCGNCFRKYLKVDFAIHQVICLRELGRPQKQTPEAAPQVQRAEVSSALVPEQPSQVDPIMPGPSSAAVASQQIITNAGGQNAGLDTRSSPPLGSPTSVIRSVAAAREGVQATPPPATQAGEFSFCSAEGESKFEERAPSTLPLKKAITRRHSMATASATAPQEPPSPPPQQPPTPPAQQQPRTTEAKVKARARTCKTNAGKKAPMQRSFTIPPVKAHSSANDAPSTSNNASRHASFQEPKKQISKSKKAQPERIRGQVAPEARQPKNHIFLCGICKEGFLHQINRDAHRIIKHPNPSSSPSPSQKKRRY